MQDFLRLARACLNDGWPNQIKGQQTILKLKKTGRSAIKETLGFMERTDISEMHVVRPGNSS